MIILTLKIYQESIISVDNFVWCLCVSYRALNTVTETFYFLITRCQDIIEKMGIKTGLYNTLSWTIDNGITRLLFGRKISVSWPSLNQMMVRKYLKSYLLVVKIHRHFLQLRYGIYKSNGAISLIKMTP